jgi:hypothetical protein
MPAPAVKSLFVTLVAAVAVALTIAAPAPAAGIPCWKALINDWYDGKIDQSYPRYCYQDAIKHLPRDVDTYSSAKDDILRALNASITNPGQLPPWDPNNPNGGVVPPGGGNDSGGSKGIITRAIEWLGPSNADAVPLPLLILAGVAFVLLAAAGGSALNRRLHDRRLPPHGP